jgi:hypothetical protein
MNLIQFEMLVNCGNKHRIHHLLAFECLEEFPEDKQTVHKYIGRFCLTELMLEFRYLLTYKEQYFCMKKLGHFYTIQQTTNEASELFFLKFEFDLEFSFLLSPCSI